LKGALAIAMLWALGGPALRLEASGPWALQGQGAAPWRPAGPLWLRAEGGQVWAGARRAPSWRFLGQAWRLEGPGGKRRAGRVPWRCWAEGGRLVVVADWPLERHVAGVVAAEVDGPWPPAAGQALAIAARSTAATWRGRHRREGFDLCDSTHCMAFRGDEAKDPAAEAAAKGTQGLGLAWRGRWVALPWHAACGGATTGPREVFGGAMPGLGSGGPDRDPQGRPWCRRHPMAGPWRCWVPQGSLAAALDASGDWQRGWRAPRLGPAWTAPDGLALSVPLGEGRSLSGQRLWQVLGAHLGWGQVRSPAFTVRPAEGGAWLAGRGLGHLVGLCQAGAVGRALAGQDARAILKAYAPALTLQASGLGGPTRPQASMAWLRARQPSSR
jgi:stage II sporulation protein D